MKIKETAEFCEFDLGMDGEDAFAFEYKTHNIGFNREQAAQMLVALQSIVDSGELPE
jgi:hypothetical protein